MIFKIKQFPFQLYWCFRGVWSEDSWLKILCSGKKLSGSLVKFEGANIFGFSCVIGSRIEKVIRASSPRQFAISLSVCMIQAREEGAYEVDANLGDYRQLRLFQFIRLNWNALRWSLLDPQTSLQFLNVYSFWYFLCTELAKNLLVLLRDHRRRWITKVVSHFRGPTMIGRLSTRNHRGSSRI